MEYAAKAGYGHQTVLIVFVVFYHPRLPEFSSTHTGMSIMPTVWNTHLERQTLDHLVNTEFMLLETETVMTTTTTAPLVQR
jgi:hypothetical protein